jgi:hypothetical protein
MVSNPTAKEKSMIRAKLSEYENVVFPKNCRAVLDVTKPPLSLDNTGREDCSRKLTAWLDSMLQLQLDEMEVTKST